MNWFFPNRNLRSGSNLKVSGLLLAYLKVSAKPPSSFTSADWLNLLVFSPKMSSLLIVVISAYLRVTYIESFEINVVLIEFVLV